MRINNLTTEQIISFFKKQWKLAGMTFAILIFLIITLSLPGKDNKATTPRPGTSNVVNNTNNKTTSKKSQNPFSFLFNSKKDDTNSSATQNVTSGVTPPPSPVAAQASPSTITKIEASGAKTMQTVAVGTVINTVQGTINPNTNIAQDLSSNTEVDNIRIIFQNPDGTTFTYIPPGTPPDEVRWGRYTNAKEKYAINYPSNWQFVYSLEDGHEGVALYPPGVNQNDPKSPFIGFGITSSFLLPAGGDTANAQITSIVVDGVSGDLYTNGPLGSSYIASILSYSGKYFGLGGSKSDATFAYVYYYMINSLTFNTE
jgi:hypothetical protein